MKLHEGQKLSLRVWSPPCYEDGQVFRFVSGDFVKATKGPSLESEKDWLTDWLARIVMGEEIPTQEWKEEDFKLIREGKAGDNFEDYWVVLYKDDDPEAPAELNFNITRRSDIENGWKTNQFGKVSLFKNGKAVALQG